MTTGVWRKDRCSAIFVSNQLNTLMEIVTIEATVFESMLEYLENAARITDELCEKLREKRMGEWLDTQEVCLLLDASPRTLQTLRENGTLAYSRISHKVYYRPEDIQKILSAIQKRKGGQI